MFQESLGHHGVLVPPKDHEVQRGPDRGDNTEYLTVTSIWSPVPIALTVTPLGTYRRSRVSFLSRKPGLFTSIDFPRLPLCGAGGSSQGRGGGRTPRGDQDLP